MITENLNIEPGAQITRIVERRVASRKWVVEVWLRDSNGSESIHLSHNNGKTRFFSDREDARFVRKHLQRSVIDKNLLSDLQAESVRLQEQENRRKAQEQLDRETKLKEQAEWRAKLAAMPSVAGNSW